MKFVATTFKDFEGILTEELESLGATIVRQPKRAVECEGSKEVFYRCLFKSRFALRILVPIGKFKIEGDKDLYKNSFQIPWHQYIDVDQSIGIVSSVHSALFNHSKYPTYKLKDAICDYFVKHSDRRPEIDTKYPDQLIHLRISEDFVTISLDAGGAPLFKRGYRTANVEAPINEIVAAAMIKHSGWENGVLLDAFCGSGTIISEAIMRRNNIPAQYYNGDLAVTRWRDFDQELWSKILDETLLGDYLEGDYYASDIDPRAVDATEENLRNKHLDEHVSLKLADFFNTKAPQPKGTLIINPPYNERLELEDENSFYRAIGDHCKKAYKGWTIWILTANFSALRKIGMKPSKKVILHNGHFECRFHRYDIRE